MTSIRNCTHNDLQAVVDLLADDPLGSTREDTARPLSSAYATAFDAMARQDGNSILLALDGDDVIGCLQLTIIHGLSRLGMSRAQIEGVRVAQSARGRGIGKQLLAAAIDRAREAGCGLVQLTTDATRADAHRFYEGHGFVASHVGMKLAL